MEVREKPFSDTFRVSTVAATLQEIDKAYKNKDVYVRYDFGENAQSGSDSVPKDWCCQKVA